MIDPLQSATQIIRDHPELAEPLYDLLICAREGRGALLEAELDDTMDYVFSKTPHGGKLQKQYGKRRLTGRTRTVEAQMPV